MNVLLSALLSLHDAPWNLTVLKLSVNIHNLTTAGVSNFICLLLLWRVLGNVTVLEKLYEDWCLKEWCGSWEASKLCLNFSNPGRHLFLKCDKWLWDLNFCTRKSPLPGMPTKWWPVLKPISYSGHQNYSEPLLTGATSQYRIYSTVCIVELYLYRN